VGDPTEAHSITFHPEAVDLAEVVASAGLEAVASVVVAQAEAGNPFQNL
jgi:hypothetical protein